MKDKLFLSNKTGFQAFCIIFSIPVNAILILVSIGYTLTTLSNKDWNFGYGAFATLVFATNLISTFSLMDYPDVKGNINE